MMRVPAVQATVRVSRTMEALLDARADDPWVTRYDADAHHDPHAAR